MAGFNFHPLVEQWFRNRFGEPTPPQTAGWPHISRGEHTLIAAPTGSGKTLAAFLVCLDRLFRRWLAGDEYTIADMICYPWTVNWKFQGQDIEEFAYFKRWFEEMGARPAVQKGMAVGADLSTDVTRLPPEEQARIRKLLYNQRAIPVKVA